MVTHGSGVIRGGPSMTAPVGQALSPRATMPLAPIFRTLHFGADSFPVPLFLP